MKKQVIGLDSSIIKLLYLPYSSYTAALSIILQHKILLNKRIVDYYLELVPEENKDNVRNYFDSIISNHEQSCIFSKDQGRDAISELIFQLCEVPNGCFVYTKEYHGEIKKELESLSLEDVMSLAKNYRKSRIYRYTIPLTNYYIGLGEKSDWIIKWFRDIFQGEKTICIQDAYIYNNNGLRVLERYYIDIFPNTMNRLVIYGSLVDSNKTEDEVKRFFSSSKFKSWEVELYDCPKFHPRCIQLKELLVSLDAGIDFIGKNGETDKACRISISKEIADNIEGARKISCS